MGTNKEEIADRILDFTHQFIADLEVDRFEGSEKEALGMLEFELKRYFQGKLGIERDWRETAKEAFDHVNE